MHNLLFCILLLFCYSFAQGPCFLVPSSIVEAQALQQQGALSEECYVLLEELYLRPLDLWQGEWRRVEPLGYALPASQMPHPSDLEKYLPLGTISPEELFKDFPLLLPLRPLLAWPLETHGESPHGTLLGSLQNYPQDGRATGRFEGWWRSTSASHYFAGSLITKESSVFAGYRLARVMAPEQGLTLSFGNPTMVRRATLWGNYDAPRCSTGMNNLLYGYGQRFNGTMVEWQHGLQGATFWYHQRFEEQLVGGEVWYQKKRGSIYGSLGVVHQGNEEKNQLITSAMHLPKLGISGDFGVSLSGGISGEITALKVKKETKLMLRGAWITSHYLVPLARTTYLQLDPHEANVAWSVEGEVDQKLTALTTLNTHLFTNFHGRAYRLRGEVGVCGGKRWQWYESSRLLASDTLKSVEYTQSASIKTRVCWWQPELFLLLKGDGEGVENTTLSFGQTFFYRRDALLLTTLSQQWGNYENRTTMMMQLQHTMGGGHRALCSLRIPLVGDRQSLVVLGEVVFRW